MAFESLIDQPLSEHEIMYVIADEIQCHYDAYQNTIGYCFIKIDSVDAQLSKVTYIKMFETSAESRNYYYDTKNRRCFIGVKFEDDRFTLLISGFKIFKEIEIYPDKIVKTYESKGREDSEKFLMIPRELVEGAFGEMSQTLTDTKSNKAS